MILGVGTDIIDSNRINKILNKHNDKFIKRVFGFNEIVLLKKKNRLKTSWPKGSQAKKQPGKLCVQEGVMDLTLEK